MGSFKETLFLGKRRVGTKGKARTGCERKTLGRGGYVLKKSKKRERSGDEIIQKSQRGKWRGGRQWWRGFDKHTKGEPDKGTDGGGLEQADLLRTKEQHQRIQ